ncbi:hypothetical protein PR048_011363 [Dryococelus australis]|uniref:Uncharacterized protein n=1 Tax=Dryococelus australis TaxID=614101 RepID=A0ABQ9HLF3_9NEOP|nr:hypothetical protein PR048_011363 [Dryococelus australis]
MSEFKVEKFSLEEESQDSYLERLEQLFIAKYEGDKAEDQNRCHVILITSVRKETYEILCNLSEPKKPPERSYHELVELLKQHFSPRLKNRKATVIFAPGQRRICQHHDSTPTKRQWYKKF